MKAEILAVGTELLMGQIINTNAQYISSKLPEAGIGVYYHSVVGDNSERLKESLKIALGRCSVVITTGGLGPTQDDLTKETIADLFGKKLVLHEESLRELKCFFDRRGRKMSHNNEKQAYLPEGCIVLKNNNGTAPGCIIEDGEKMVIMLPGPPSEMKPMFDDYVLPYFKQKSMFSIESRFLRIFGIGESELETRLIDLIDHQTNPTLATYAKEGEVTLRVSAKVQRDEDAQKLLNPVIDAIKERIGDCLYAENDATLDEVVANLLLQNGLTISTAESCTGGLISEILTDIPGISESFAGGIIAYSDAAKVKCLGVSQQTLKDFGAVSHETAGEMAEGVRDRLQTDIGISVTGIAGPGGGTELKPVGLVYIGLASDKGVITKELLLSGSRKRIRAIATLNIFDMVRRYVLGLEIEGGRR